jgi:small subunit ribosomal protein S8
MNRTEVKVPSSRLKVGIARVLKEEGYIGGYDVVEDDKQGILRINLKYGPRGEKVFQQLERVSTPGRRVYRKVNDLPQVLGGLGIGIVSTSNGVLSDRECRKQRVGGEVLCTVC